MSVLLVNFDRSGKTLTWLAALAVLSRRERTALAHQFLDTL